MKHHKRVKVAAFAAVVGMVLAGCGGGSGETPNTSTTGRGGTLTLGILGEPTSWDSAQAHVGHALQPYQAVYDSLILRQPDGKLDPMLATKWTYNAARTELTLDLRTDVTFSDGTKFDAEAVKANFDHFKTANGRQAAQLTAHQSTTVVDADTVTITLSAPDPAFLFYLSQAAGLMASPKAIAGGNLKALPVGSGPYVWSQAEYTAGSQAAFTARDGYWNPSLQKFDKITMKILLDITARVNALVSGQIDAITLDPNTVKQAEGAGMRTLSDYQVDWQGLLLFDRGGKLVPALADVRVRQAINHAIDRNTLLQQLQLGRGTATTQVFGPASGAYVPELDQRYPFDPAKARQLMADAGYASGFDLTVPTGTGFDSVMAVLTQQLGDVGIRVKTLTVPAANLVPDLAAGKYPVGYFNLFQGEPWVAVNQLISTTALYNPFDSATPELDALLKAVQNGGDKSSELAKDVNRYIVENAWFAPLYRIDQIFAYNKRINVVKQIQQAVPSIYNFSRA